MFILVVYSDSFAFYNDTRSKSIQQKYYGDASVSQRFGTVRARPAQWR